MTNKFISTNKDDLRHFRYTDNQSYDQSTFILSQIEKHLFGNFNRSKNMNKSPSTRILEVNVLKSIQLSKYVPVYDAAKLNKYSSIYFRVLDPKILWSVRCSFRFAYRLKLPDISLDEVTEKSKFDEKIKIRQKLM